MTRYRIPSSVLVQEVADETVLLDLDRGVYFGLDEIGTRMLQLYRQCNDVDTVVERMAAEFDATPSRIRTDFLALMAQLERDGLIETVE